MLAHAANNVLVIVLYRAGYEDPPGSASRLTPLWLLASLAVLAGALRLIRPRREQD